MRAVFSSQQQGDNYFQVPVRANITRRRTFRDHLQGLDAYLQGGEEWRCIVYVMVHYVQSVVPENFTVKEDDQRLLMHTSLGMVLTQTVLRIKIPDVYSIKYQGEGLLSWLCFFGGLMSILLRVLYLCM